MNLEDGTLVQGDGALAHKSKTSFQPQLHVIQKWHRHLIRSLHAFRKGKYNRSAVQVISERDLESVPMAAMTSRLRRLFPYI
jgi:hypothetical protein